MNRTLVPLTHEAPGTCQPARSWVVICLIAAIILGTVVPASATTSSALATFATTSSSFTAFPTPTSSLATSPTPSSPLATSATLPASPTYIIEVDNIPIVFDTEPIVQNNRLLVPFRAIAESLGIAVEWLQETRTVKAVGEGKTVLLSIDSSHAIVSETPSDNINFAESGISGESTLSPASTTRVPLDALPVVSNNRVLIPLRFFAETFGCTVWYDAPVRTAEVRSPYKDLEILAWYAMDENWQSLFGAPYPSVATGGTDVVDTVSFGWYELAETGELTTTGTQGWRKPSGWEYALNAARDLGLNTEMTVWMSDKTGSLTRLMADPAAHEAAADAIATAAADYDSVNLDLEGLGLTDTGEVLALVRNTYTAFVTGVAARLHAQGKTLTLTLHPLNGAYHGYDYAAVGAIADRIAIMAYDYGTRPEPHEQVVAAMDLALSVVPAEKLLLGISLASESAESLVSKLGIAKRKGIAGVALWRLGLMHEDDWSALRLRYQVP